MSESILTREQVYAEVDAKMAERMAELPELQDTEAAHITADNLLCVMLQKVGFPKTVAAFKELTKYYACILLLLTSTAQAKVVGQWFSPKGGATQAIVDYCDEAEKEINCQLYSFTSKPIADALIRAKKRGVKVTLLLDASANKTADRTQADECADAGISVYIDAEHKIAHNKTGIFDGKVVLLGSFNWSAAAENSNAETLIAFDDAQRVTQCAENFKQHLAHSKKFK